MLAEDKLQDEAAEESADGKEVPEDIGAQLAKSSDGSAVDCAEASE